MRSCGNINERIRHPGIRASWCRIWLETKERKREKSLIYKDFSGFPGAGCCAPLARPPVLRLFDHSPDGQNRLRRPAPNPGAMRLRFDYSEGEAEPDTRPAPCDRTAFESCASTLKEKSHRRGEIFLLASPARFERATFRLGVVEKAFRGRIGFNKNVLKNVIFIGFFEAAFSNRSSIQKFHTGNFR